MLLSIFKNKIMLRNRESVLALQILNDLKCSKYKDCEISEKDDVLYLVMGIIKIKIYNINEYGKTKKVMSLCGVRILGNYWFNKELIKHYKHLRKLIEIGEK